MVVIKQFPFLMSGFRGWGEEKVMKIHLQIIQINK